MLLTGFQTSAATQSLLASLKSLHDGLKSGPIYDLN